MAALSITPGLRTAVDNLTLVHPEFESERDGWIREMGGSSDGRIVKSKGELYAAMADFVLVKLLIINTHGSPGRIYLPGVSAGGNEFGRYLEDHPQFLMKDARILFLGCSVGAGAEGDDFMRIIGKALKGRGGYVGASTVTVNAPCSHAAFLKPDWPWKFSDGRLKVRRFDSNGQEIGFMQVDRAGNRY